jgi:hypothetical protein
MESKSGFLRKITQMVRNIRKQKNENLELNSKQYGKKKPEDFGFRFFCYRSVIKTFSFLLSKEGSRYSL